MTTEYKTATTDASVGVKKPPTTPPMMMTGVRMAKSARPRAPPNSRTVARA
jgi:hypothetical protein